MARFADIAHKKLDDIERPPLAPVGNYIFEVINDPQPVLKQTANGEFEVVDFQLRGLQAMDDVDTAELEVFGGAKGVIVRKGFIFNTDPAEEANFKRTEYEMKTFLEEHLQITEAEELTQAMAMAKGRTCIGEVGHRPDKENPDRIYLDLKKTMPID